MFPNLKAELVRNGITYKELGEKVGKSENWIENRILGKATMPIGECMKIRNSFFPNCSYDYLFSSEAISPQHYSKTS